MKGFLEYAPGDTFLHRLNPVIKLLFALLICVAAFASSNIVYLIVLIAFNVALGCAAGEAGRSLRLLRGFIKLSVFLFVIQVFFYRSGNILLSLPLGLYITDLGIVSALLVVLRLMAAALPLLLMLSVTRLRDLSNALVVMLHVPYKYAFTLTTAIRFIPLFAAEMNDIMEAQTSRGVEFDTKNPFKKLGLILPLCVPLLTSSVRNIDETAISARLRGFDLRTRESCTESYPVKPADIASVVFAAALAALAMII